MRVRVPDPLKTPLLLALLLGLHFGWTDRAEGLRLPLLRLVAAPTPASDDWAITPVPGWLDGAMEAARTRARGGVESNRGRLLSVLDLEHERGWLIVGGGAECGVAPGAWVIVADGCIGGVDRVTTHLARVRLLTALDVQFPIERDPHAAGSALPGRVERLFGFLRGDGDGAEVATAHRPREFRRGDVLCTLADGADDRAWPVGEITREGPRPRVRLLARPDRVPAVFVCGVLAEPQPIFEEHPLEVALSTSGRLRGVLVKGAALGRVLPGCGVHAGGRYLGRVLRLALGTAHVVRASDPGSSVEVVLIGRGGISVPARLEGRGAGVLSVTDVRGRLPPGPILAVTAGGQELVPAGLLVAEGTVHNGVLDGASTPWPREVRVSVFRWANERRRLRERSR
jgi:cell shape-determining protein MreC